MSTISTTINKAKTETVNKVSAILPIQIQIKVVYLYQKLRGRIFENKDFTQFIERPIPEVSTLDLNDINLSNPFLFRQHRWQSYYKRLRDEAPVHYQANSPFGAFWSITRYEDILFVDRNYQLFSSEPIIMLGNRPKGLEVEMFIAMDPPEHDVQRKAVQGVVAPQNLKEMESLIRERTVEVLDSLPIGVSFDFVQKVSIELSKDACDIIRFPL